MADVRIADIAVPEAPERYDSRNEADFRRVVQGLKDEIDNVLQRLKTAARDGVVLTTGAQDVAGVKTFSSNPVIENANPGIELDETGEVKMRLRAAAGNWIAENMTDNSGWFGVIGASGGYKLTVPFGSGAAEFANGLTVSNP